MDPIILVMGGLGMLGVMGFMGVALSCFKKCGPDQVMIVSGLISQDSNTGLAFQIVPPGKGSVVFPTIQQHHYLNVHLRRIDVSGSATTKDLLPWKVQISLGYKISTEPELLPKAVECFLNHDEEIDKTVRATIISQLNVYSRLYTRDELESQWVAFELGLKKAIEQDLNRVGLQLISLTIQETSKDSAAEQALPFR